MFQSVLAVLSGFATMAVLVMLTTAIAASLLLPGGMRGTAHPTVPLPRAYLTMNLSCSALAAVGGGMVTGRIAPGAPLGHGVALMLLMVTMSAVSMHQAGARQPRWYQLALLALMPPLALAGSWVIGLWQTAAR
jgi:hypothetical protein